MRETLNNYRIFLWIWRLFFHYLIPTLPSLDYLNKNTDSRHLPAKFVVSKFVYFYLFFLQRLIQAKSMLKRILNAIRLAAIRVLLLQTKKFQQKILTFKIFSKSASQSCVGMHIRQTLSSLTVNHTLWPVGLRLVSQKTN